MGRATIPEEWKKAKGNKCVNCGTVDRVDYYYIIPLDRGGFEVIGNVAPMCVNCRKLIIADRLMNKYKIHDRRRFNQGRPSNVRDDVAFKALDLYAAGVIGREKCKELMKCSKGSQLTKSAQYLRWKSEHGIKTLYNHFENTALNSPASMVDGRAIGWIEYEDGRIETINYKYSDVNDTVYSFHDKKRYPKPMTLTEFRSVYGVN